MTAEASRQAHEQKAADREADSRAVLHALEKERLLLQKEQMKNELEDRKEARALRFEDRREMRAHQERMAELENQKFEKMMRLFMDVAKSKSE